jgi:Uma2 family endonuclease
MADRAEVRERMTVEEFLAFEGEPDVRYELVGGELRAMAPPTDRHSALVMECGVAIRERLRRRPGCRVLAEAGIRISDEDFLVADLAVSCQPLTGTPMVAEPLLIVEVLSPSTRQHDLSVKGEAYRRLPSVRELWFVEADRRRVQQWRREAEHVWRVEDVIGSGRVESPVLDAAIPLDELYAGLDDEG